MALSSRRRLRRAANEWANLYPITPERTRQNAVAAYQA
jgi:hypothetical protein